MHRENRLIKWPLRSSLYNDAAGNVLLLLISGGSNAGFAANSAERMLEDVQTMRKTLKDEINPVLDKSLANLDHFLDSAAERFEEMKKAALNFERMAAQYGYKPKLDPEMTVQKAVLEAKRKKEQQQEQETGENAEDEEEMPNLFDAGLSKNALKLMGLTFKDDVAEVNNEVEVRNNDAALIQVSCTVNSA